MTYRMMLFTNHSGDELSTLHAFDYMMQLTRAGHPVKSSQSLGEPGDGIIYESWLEFDCEANAALYKLTHL